MPETFDLYMHSGSGWDIEIDDYAGFGGDSGALAAISQDAWQRYSIKTDATMSANNGTGQNCRYISATEIQLNGGSTVTLTTGNVAQTNCTFRWHYTDSAGATVLSNPRFFVYSGAPTTAPSDMTAVAFERTSGAINVDSVSGTGRAWNANYGIGGSGNALILSDQASATDHYFYIGMSVKPTARGLNTFVMRVEFDVS